MDQTKRQSLTGYCLSRKLVFCLSLVILWTLLGTTLLAYTTLAVSHSNHDTLRQVVFLFRHGDRTPTETYPKDPYINYSWPGGWGALTKKGMLQLYKVGQWIRDEYSGIIGNKYESAATLARSSYADRCVMSAQALFAGLFPPSFEDMFVPNLTWTPVPVHSIPRNLDKLITVKAPCPRLEKALKEAYLDEARRSDAKMANYYSELRKHTGQNMQTITDIEFLYNTLEIEEQNSLQLPEWTWKFYNNEMRGIAIRSLEIFTNTTVQKRLLGGPLLKEILYGFEEARNGPKSKRSYFYSVHDITIINVLRTMGFTNLLLKPDYAATLIFELHLAHNGTEVKVLYLANSETKVAQLLEIPNCANPCLLENLKQVWHDMIPNDWDTECKL